MRRLLATLVWICISWNVGSSQVSYLNSPDLLEKVEACLHNTYGFSFEEARDLQDELSLLTPGHPAPVFLEALIVYWENFPLTPSSKASGQFIRLMDQCIDMAQGYIQNDQTYTEGVFFDLYGRAFKTMFWADNGKSGKVVSDLGTMYRHTKEGFELQEQFVEFYFSTGLYNYYVEAFPEAHPAYKPLLAFMQKGDRALGLKQLNHAINSTVFLKVESQLFMSLIQLNYEEDLNTAARYAERLVREYPANIYYRGHLVNILLHQHRFENVRTLLSEISEQRDDYSKMIRSLAAAYMAEQESGLRNDAERGYLLTLELAETFGPITNVYQAMSYMGLSRLYDRKGEQSESRKYARKASRHTSYAFILEEKSGSR